MGFLIVFLILPYFIGIQKAKRLKNDILDSNKLLLSKILEAIDLATDKTIIPKIESLQKLIIAEYEKLVASDIGIEAGLRFDGIKSENDLAKAEILPYHYYKEARAFDSRFGYFDFLNHTYNELEELKFIERDNNNSAIRKEQLEKYIEHFKDYKNDLSTKEESKGKSSPAMWIGLIAILTPFISQLMSEIGKYLIGIFKSM